MRIKPAFSILILASLLSFSTAFAWDDEGEQRSFDIGTFQELNKKSQSIWDSIVRTKGSESGAIEAVYLKGSRPDPRLQELHSEVTQFLDSSAFEKNNLIRLNLPVSGLMRFTLSNIALHYGKYVSAKIKDPTLQKMLIDCAATPFIDEMSGGCMRSFGQELNLVARKAGRAALLLLVSQGRSDIKIARSLYSMDVSTPKKFALYEKQKVEEKRKDGLSVCSSILNKFAQTQTIELLLFWSIFGSDTDKRANNFVDYAYGCRTQRSAAQISIEQGVLPNEYVSITEIADAYFPNDFVK